MDDYPDGFAVIMDAYKHFWETILRYWGLTIRVSDLPQYVLYAALRDELAAMHPIRRWLSWHKQRELQALRIQAEAAILNAVIEAEENRE